MTDETKDKYEENDADTYLERIFKNRVESTHLGLMIPGILFQPGSGRNG